MAIIIGTSAANKLKGTSGKDNLSGLGGNDTLTGGAGNDILDGGTGNDSLNGGTGNDTYLYKTNSFGDDTIVDSDGVDTLNMSALSAAITASMTPSGGNEVAVGSHTINWGTSVFIENLTAGKGADVISGNALNNYLIGNAGGDSMDGGGGQDTMDGGAGNDSFTGGSGNDVIINSDGADTVTGGTGNDTYLYLTLENDGAGNGDTILETTGGIDTLDFSAISEGMGVSLSANQVAPLADLTFEIIDSATSDLSQIENVITGDGNDFIFGNDVDNIFITGKGVDFVSGGVGNDIIIDGDGEDFYGGGVGDDLYIYTRGQTNLTDLITESAGSDQLKLAGFNYNDLTFAAMDNDGNTFLDGLMIYDYTNNWTLIIADYFDDLQTNEDLSAPGDGCIENIAVDNNAFITFSGIQTILP